MQLTADQQVQLSVSGTDKYGNPVEIGGDTVWLSSDESIVQVVSAGNNPTTATASAVGPTGTAAVTVTNDADRDGTGDFMGSIAIDVVAGDISEIAVQPGTPMDKGADAGGGERPDQGLPGKPPGTSGEDPNRPDQGLPGRPPGTSGESPDRPNQGPAGGTGRPDAGGPGDQPEVGGGPAPGRPNRPNQGPAEGGAQPRRGR